MGGAPEKQIKEALKQRTSDRPRQFFIKVCGAIDKEYSSLYLLRPKHLDRQILSFKFSYHLLPSCLLFSCEFWALSTHSSHPAKAQLFPPARCRPARPRKYDLYLQAIRYLEEIEQKPDVK